MPENEKEIAVTVVEARPLMVKLTDVAIETIQHNIKMSEKLVYTLLERGVDFGRLPGMAQEGLWEPGADKILNGFNCYTLPEVLFHIEEDGLISYTILSKAISRDTQQVVGSGIGAASTRETKYKYRWVPDPKNYGYSEEQIKTLKTKTRTVKGKPEVEFRIENPEYGELVNTMAKMSKKRADVAAAQELPGVSSALRKLFGGLVRPELDWNAFWGQTSSMGLKESDVHDLLGVKSMKEWTGSGRTLQEAIQVIAAKLTEKAKKAAEVAHKAAPKRRDPETVKPEEVPDGFALEKIANQCWGWQPKKVWDELNYTSARNFQDAGVEKAWDCFLKLKAVAVGPPGENQATEPELEPEDLPF